MRLLTFFRIIFANWTLWHPIVPRFAFLNKLVLRKQLSNTCAIIYILVAIIQRLRFAVF